MSIENNLEIKTYLDEVCSYIKCKEVHEQIKLELLDHFEELLQDYLESGLTLEESINKVLQNMGDPILIGKQLNSAHKAKPEWSIIGLSFVFSLIGLLALFFIKSTEFNAYLNSAFYKSTIFSLFGVAIVFFLYFFDYRKLKKYSKAIYIFTVCILIIIHLFPHSVNGASYLHVGPLYMDFTSISPILFIIALSGIFMNWNWNDPKKFILALILSIIPIILMEYCCSTMSSCIFIAAFVVLMIASRAKVYQILSIIIGYSTILLSYVFSSHYRVKIYFAFMFTSKDPSGLGYLYIVIKKLIHSAGLWGNGPSFPTTDFVQRNGIIIHHPSLPFMHTNFIFTYIIYSFGWIVAICLVALISLFIVRMFKASERVKDDYGKLLIKGFLSILSFKFIWSILMNLGLLPIVSIGIPFISYGGSDFITNMIMIGLISSVYKLKSVNLISEQKNTLNVK